MKFNYKSSLLGLSLVALAFAGCGEDQNQTAAPEASTPPSLSQSDTSAQTVLIQLNQKQAEELQIKTVTAELRNFDFIIASPGMVYAAPEHISMVSAPINGRVTRIFAHEGEAVRAGQPLLELESLEFANLAADYLESAAEVRYQEQQTERLKRLVEKKISPQRALDKAMADLSRANARLRAAASRLKAIGIRDDELSQWENGGTQSKPTLRVYAPLSGTINEHLIDLGQSVNAYDKMMDIIDNRTVLARAFVAPEDASLMQPGDSLKISTPQLKEMTTYALHSAITSINPALDPENKSIAINAILNTRDGWPVIGQNVRFHIQATTPNQVIGLPLDAVQYEGDRATIFVQKDPLTYEKRYIEISRITPNSVIVQAGINPGEKVAVSQVFSLKALGKYEEFAD